MGNEFIVNNASFDSLEDALVKKTEEKLYEEVVIENKNVVDDNDGEDDESCEDEECDDECCEECEDDEFDDSPIIRAKWSIDGASTLDEAVEKLHEFIAYLKSLKEEGWELRDTIDDDYGFLKKIT